MFQNMRTALLLPMVQRLVSSKLNMNIRKYFPLRLGCVCIALLFGLSMQACTASTRYAESYTVSNLNVVFLDDQSLKEAWTKVTGRPGVEFVQNMSKGSPQVKTVNGFYDFSTNTVYCPKWNFEVCGHELHHAVLGQFHEAS